MNIYRALWAVLLLAVATPLSAAYITDKLVAGMYEQADKSTPPVAALASGTPMEVLQRKLGFSKVRLTNGDVGWVESSFVSKEKPARVMLLEKQSEMAGMKKQIRQKDAALQAMQADASPAHKDEVKHLKKQLADAQRMLLIQSDVQSMPLSNDEALKKAEAQIEALQALLAEKNSASIDQDGLANENHLLRQRLSAAAKLLDISDLSENSQSIESAILGLSMTQWLFMLAAAVLGLLLGMIIISISRRRHIAAYRI